MVNEYGKIVLGIIGGFGLWNTSSSLEAFNSEEIIEPLRIWPIVIYVIFLIAGIFGIYDLIKKLKGF